MMVAGAGLFAGLPVRVAVSQSAQAAVFPKHWRKILLCSIRLPSLKSVCRCILFRNNAIDLRKGN
jgi:hypothetical protein